MGNFNYARANDLKSSGVLFELFYPMPKSILKNVIIILSLDESCTAFSSLYIPLSMLRVHGFSNMFLTLAQSAWVFQVLAKAAEVPSTTPLMALKSSV